MGHAKPPGSGKPSDAFDASLDRALASWPAPRAGVDWAAKAAQTADRAKAAAQPERPSDADLMRPPLPATPRESGGRLRLWLVTGGIAATTAAAVAAGTLLFAAHTPEPADHPVAYAGTKVVRIGVGPRPGMGWRPVPSAGADTPGVDPADLPVVQTAAARSVSGLLVQAPSPSPARAAAPQRPVAAAAEPAAEPDPALDDSLRPAAGAGSAASVPDAPWNVPRRPGVGAIQAAFAAVLPAARTCLAAGDPAVRTVVTYRSDGTVEDVSLAGGTARTASADISAQKGACLRSALEKARIPPFSESTFQAPVTVRY
jgi:hypothetical protein